MMYLVFCNNNFSNPFLGAFTTLDLALNYMCAIETKINKYCYIIEDAVDNNDMVRGVIIHCFSGNSLISYSRKVDASKGNFISKNYFVWDDLLLPDIKKLDGKSFNLCCQLPGRYHFTTKTKCDCGTDFSDDYNYINFKIENGNFPRHKKIENCVTPPDLIFNL